jgi:methylated-DNA-[protein]-cysteine S-methyltransferase
MLPKRSEPDLLEEDEIVPTIAFAMFETAIGACGIAWTERGLLGVQLPEGRDELTAARLRRRFPAARQTSPPPDVEGAIGRIGALLQGERIDLREVVLDMEGLPVFDRSVYLAAREIPAGRTLTYGEIAKRIGEPDAARDVGVALARNPFPIVVPCHRVVAANGKLGGFSGAGGAATKRRLLAIEGGSGPLFE